MLRKEILMFGICRDVCLFILISVCLFTCQSKQVKQADTSSVESVERITDTSYIFDGVSLDGWDIADFPLPGKVSVKNGEILLEAGCISIETVGIIFR